MPAVAAVAQPFGVRTLVAKVSEVSVGFGASVSLEGDSLEGGDFTFEIVAQGSDEVVATATNDADGYVDFGELDYDMASLGSAVADGHAEKSTNQTTGVPTWTIHYTAREVVDALPAGVTAVTSSFDFAVVVSEGADGELVAAVELPEGCGFVNACAADTVQASLCGSMTFVSAEGFRPGGCAQAFSYIVTADEGTPLPEAAEATNDAFGNVSFGTITFDASCLDDVEPEDDGSLSKTFSYVISESGTLDGVTCDEDKVVEITVSQDAEGNLTASRTSSVAFVFANVYDAGATVTLGASVTLDGGELREGQYTFRLTDADGAIVDETVNDAYGGVAFDSMAFSEEGVYTFTIAQLEDRTEESVNDGTTFEVSVVVAKDENGDLVASVSYDQDPVFVNLNSFSATGERSSDVSSSWSEVNLVAIAFVVLDVVILLACGIFVLKNRKSKDAC